MSFTAAYLLFLLKSLTFVVVLVIVTMFIIAISSRKKNTKSDDDDLEVTYLNAKNQSDQFLLNEAILTKKEKKQYYKNPHKPDAEKARLFVIDFYGDIQASETDVLTKKINAILMAAKEKDEVLLRLESPGGIVYGYGLAAAELSRLKQANIPVTIAVDRVAASGGYMMACVANKIVAAPFAVLGSIGVVAQMPNFHRFLKDKQVDVELHTAGEYKRTLTTLGENTEEGRKKFIEELNLTHDLFKQFVSENRPQLDVAAVATGETWYGTQALENGLIDEVNTSDDLILKAMQDKDVYLIATEVSEGLLEKVKSLLLAKINSLGAYKSLFMSL